MKMERIVEWLMSCGYSESDARKEAEIIVEHNRWDGVERCSREYAIQMILENIQ
jgi:hypothetical protein